MTPLVYVFAGAAVVLGAGFVAAAGLSFLHARNRGRRAQALREYVALPAVADRKETAERHRLRRTVMQITMGDLIRDDELVAAVADGLAERRKSKEPPPAAPAAG